MGKHHRELIGVAPAAMLTAGSLLVAGAALLRRGKPAEAPAPTERAARSKRKPAHRMASREGAGTSAKAVVKTKAKEVGRSGPLRKK